MELTYKDLKKITFPVFQLPSNEWELSDGLLILEELVVDDRNIEEETLGLRRLKTPFNDVLYPLKKSIPNEVALIKSKKPYYIDSKGIAFTYIKSIYMDLKFFRIKGVEKKEVASVLTVHGLRNSFIIPRPPPQGMWWVGILFFRGVPWKLYEYSIERKRNSRRKI